MNPTYVLASDIHFGEGSESPRHLTCLNRELERLGDDAVLIVSGDFTQRAKAAEYQKAGAWIRTVLQRGTPVIITPGNHDFGGVRGEMRGTKRAWRERYISRIMGPVKEAASSWPSEVAVVHGRGGDEKYDSITRVGMDVFVSLRSVHKRTRAARKPFRITGDQLSWAGRELRARGWDDSRLRRHLVTHLPPWKAPSSSVWHLKHGWKNLKAQRKGQRERGRLAQKLLLKYRFQTVIHGHTHLLTRMETRLQKPKSKPPIDRISIPTLSVRTRKGHPTGFLTWQPGSEPKVHALVEPSEDETSVRPLSEWLEEVDDLWDIPR